MDEEVSAVSAAATDEYNRTVNLMLLVAAIGIGVGLGLGFVIGQFGVVKPLSAMVRVLQSLAGGNNQVEITGQDRRDEIGDVAKTAVVFRDNALEKIRLEDEQKAAEQRAIEVRKADMRNWPTPSRRPSETSSRRYPVPRSSSRARQRL